MLKKVELLKNETQQQLKKKEQDLEIAKIVNHI